MKYNSNNVLDQGLDYIVDQCNALHLLPAGTYTDAATALAASLGRKAAPSISLDDATPRGRKAVGAAFVDGAGTDDGTATMWAWIHEEVASEGDELLIVGELAASVPITNGSPFPLSAQEYTLPGVDPS